MDAFSFPLVLGDGRGPGTFSVPSVAFFEILSKALPF